MLESAHLIELNYPRLLCQPACTHEIQSCPGTQRDGFLHPPLALHLGTTRRITASFCSFHRRYVLAYRRLPRARRPERAERAEALEVVPQREQAPDRLPRRQDLVHVLQRLLPEMVRLRNQECRSGHESNVMTGRWR